jgi:2-polyprenyl-6-hydroxyphenyl methylase/3-demethylubiquinone-9 3-methyltransferase
LWKEGGGYYGETPEELRKQPILPDLRRLLDRRLLALFERYAKLTVGSRVLEVGCGRSPWLPVLALQLSCSVVGVDIEPFAAELARANLSGAGAKGEILCRDAFDLNENEDLAERFDAVYSRGVLEHFDDPSRRLGVLAKYLRPEGRILTTVPNLRGVNWLLQRLADLERLEMHVIYDSKKLARVHEAAGFETIAAGYVGYYDGYLTATGTSTGRVRRGIHGWLCWASSMCCEAWVRVASGVATPELSWIAPHVFYVGRRV